jgi:hypothetical protein
MKYYGFLVNILSGSIENLKAEASFKPAHEDVGMFGFAKWFKTKKESDDARKFIKTVIDKHKQGIEQVF